MIFWQPKFIHIKIRVRVILKKNRANKMECGCDSKRKRRIVEEKLPCYRELRAGKPEGPNPLYLVVDWDYAVEKLSPSDPYYYSKWTAELNQSIEGYSKCSLVHAYINNVPSFSGNNMGYLGISIEELPGAARVAVKNPTSSGKQFAPPSFLAPRVYPFLGTQGAPDTQAICYMEQSLNQINLDVSTFNSSRLHINLCDELFNILKVTGAAPNNFEFRCLLRFYNDITEKAACNCNPN